MPTVPTAEQQAGVSVEQRRNVAKLRRRACLLGEAAMKVGSTKHLNFIRTYADAARDGADELEAALDAGQPTKTVIGIWWKLVRDPMLAIPTADVSKAYIEPRQE